MDRNCDLPTLGDLDLETGEFWSGRSKDMTKNRQNTSAFERNRLFLNRGEVDFVDASFASGCDIDSDSRSVIAADFDRDGKNDLLVGSVGGGALRLFRNDVPHENHSITLRLFGTQSNPNGIGSRITLRCGDRTIRRDIFPPNGCLGLGPAEQTIGVGTATLIDEMIINWPSGAEQVLCSIPVDRLVFVKEGVTTARYKAYTDFIGK